MRLLSSTVIGRAADAAIHVCHAGDLNILFMTAGLGKFVSGPAYSKSSLVSAVITPALRAANDGDESAKDSLNEFVLLVAQRVGPKSPEEVVIPGSAFWRLREAARSDGFDLRPDFSDDARPQQIGMRLLPLDEPKMPLSEEITALEADFARLGLTVARNHYRQAVRNFVKEDFEAANGQLRSMLESVIIHFAVTEDFSQAKQGEGGNAIAYLRDNGYLSDREGGDFVRGLWWIVQTNGPHPGTTTAGEVHFRMLTMTGAARYLMDRFGSQNAPSASPDSRPNGARFTVARGCRRGS
jgi:hypothetical protein